MKKIFLFSSKKLIFIRKGYALCLVLKVRVLELTEMAYSELSVRQQLWDRQEVTVQLWVSVLQRCPLRESDCHVGKYSFKIIHSLRENMAASVLNLPFPWQIEDIKGF